MAWERKMMRTVRVRNERKTGVLARLLVAIASVDASVGSMDMITETAQSVVRDITIYADDADHMDHVIEAMRANGLALGGTAENAVVVDGDTILTPGGLRHADEPVRHKMLDALGDLSLAGAPLLGQYTGYRAGHSLTNTLLRALFAEPDAVRLVKCDAVMAARLPGSGLVWDEIPQVA